MKKINLKKEEENRIISLFEGGESIRKICKITNYSQSLVQRVLCEKNKTERFKSNKNYIAVCKKTKKQYNDFKNSSGILIKHIQNNYNNIDIPSKFKRKSYEREFNQMWHEKFFKIEEIGEKKEEFKCKFCLWKTNDINNSSGSYTKHLLLNHKINIEKYLSIFPSDDYLFKTFILKQIKKIIMLNVKFVAKN